MGTAILNAHEEHRGHRSGRFRLAAAYLLSRRHRVQLFEKEHRLGGHTNTVLVASTPAGEVAVDTGFLVHNDRTYPNLVRSFAELGVATRNSDMSFAVSCRQSGLEYSSRGANGFFASGGAWLGPAVRTVPCRAEIRASTGQGRAPLVRISATPRPLSRIAALRRGVHASLSAAHGIGDLVGIGRRDPIVSGRHAHPIPRQSRVALAERPADVEGGRRAEAAPTFRR